MTYARDSFVATYSLELYSEVRCLSIVYKYTGRGIGFISVFQHYESEYYRIILGEKDKWNSAELSLSEVQTEKVFNILIYPCFTGNIVRRFEIHKQPPRGVLQKRCYENMQQIYRITPMPKCDFNEV